MSNSSNGKIIPGHGVVGRFILGQPISQVLFKLQSQPRVFGPISIISPKTQANQGNEPQPIFIILEVVGYKLRFDARFQRLDLIEIFLDTTALRDKSKRQNYSIPDLFIGTATEGVQGISNKAVVGQFNRIDHSSIYSGLNFTDITQMFGATFQPKIKGNTALLGYSGIKFLFLYKLNSGQALENNAPDLPGISGNELNLTPNKLVKITIFNDEQLNELARIQDPATRNIPSTINKISSCLCYKKCRILPNQGIEFYFDSEKSSMRKQIYFRQSVTEVLERLGNPNKEYYMGSALYLNYFELGVDIMIENQDFSVKKIIVHSNKLEMPDFCFYDRCSFELLLSKQIEAKLPGPNNEDLLSLSRIQKVEDLNASESQYNAILDQSGISTPPKKDRQVIEEEKDDDGEADKLQNQLEQNLKPDDVDKQEYKFDSPSQSKEQILNQIENANEQSSFMDNDKIEGDYAPKIYTKETMTVTPDTDFQKVHDFLQTGHNQNGDQQENGQNTQFYQRNFPNNGNFQTRFYAYQTGIIFEVIPGKVEGEHGGQIASIQLFQGIDQQDASSVMC